MEEDDTKEIQKEKNYIGLLALLAGLPLGLLLSGVFYFSGLYLKISENIMFRLTDNIPNIMFTLITLPWTVASFTAALIGGAKLGRKKNSTRPLKVAISNMVDFSLWMNGTTISIGILFFNTFKPASFLNPYIALPLVTIISLLTPIVGIPVILDFLMPKLWKTLSCHGYGFFEGKLVRNLIHSWEHGELQRELHRRLRIGLLLVLLLYAAFVILALLAFLR